MLIFFWLIATSQRLPADFVADKPDALSYLKMDIKADLFGLVE
jgi:hypothetical protein